MQRSLLAIVACLAFAGSAWSEDLTDLEIGTRIKAKGIFAPGETILRVEKVRVRESGDDDFELSGRVTGLHSETLAFRLESTWIIPTGRGLTRRDLRRIERLEKGDHVKVEGEWSEREHLIVDQVMRLRPAKQEASVEGVIQGIAKQPDGSSRVTLGGIDLMISSESLIQGPK